MYTKVQKTCDFCGKKYFIKQSRLKRNKSCSKECNKKLKSVRYSGRNNPNTRYSNLDDNFFEQVDTIEKAYMLGWIASDGSIPKSGFSVNIKSYDSYLFNSFDEILGIKKRLYVNIVRLMTSYAVSSMKMAEDLVKLLKLNFKTSSRKKSDIVKFPDLPSKELGWAFIRGYFDGDGHINNPRKIKNRIPKATITSNSLEILEEIREFTKIPATIYEDGKGWVIEWNGVNAIDLLSKIYSDTSLYTRQKNRLFLYRKYDNYLQWLAWRPALNGYWKTEKAIWTKIHNDAKVPQKAHESDAGYDLTIVSIHKKIGNMTLYGTGIKVNIPYGYYFDMVPRSSIIKTGYIQANSIGIIDPSYVGEIMIGLLKIDETVPDLELPCRIGQLILREKLNVEFNYVESLDELNRTERNSDGFGSSGK